MKREEYRPRVTDQILREMLESVGAVLIEGPKWCGKTTSAEHIARTVVRMDAPEDRERALQIARIEPQRLLRGETPVLLDEWQLAPMLWDAVRYEVDTRGEDGQFILTGSAVPADMSQVHHTGAGRFAVMRMRTMSLYESGDSDGAVSLAELFAGQSEIWAECDTDLDRLAFLIARGGWPRAVTRAEKYALRHAENYYDIIVRTDISRVDGVKRSEIQTANLMRSYARFVGTQAKLTKIVADIQEEGGMRISTNTAASYIAALKKIFVVEEAENWSPSLRARATLRTGKTHYFTDPSLAVAAFGADPAELIRDLPTMGLLFENLAVRDLRIYADALDGKVYHYLNNNGLEIDAILRLRNGRYALIEIKLEGDSQSIDEAAALLTKFASMVNTNRSPEPAFLMVLTGLGRVAYRRPDGVYVVPIATLKN